MEGWDNFFVAEVGASAALAGLIFVGVSINLSRILAVSVLPNRALVALILLLNVFVVSSLALVPRQPLGRFGAEELVVAAIAWLAIARLDRVVWRETREIDRRKTRVSVAIDYLTGALFFVAGISILLTGADGVCWLVPATLISFFKAFLDAWVLLVEINR